MTDIDLAGLEAMTIESFAPRVGDRFVLENEHDSHELALVACQPHGRSLQREAFSLTFLGPADPILTQRIYRLRHAELGILEIFLVPVGSDSNGTRYEAAFT
jgi:hypothetical protein